MQQSYLNRQRIESYDRMRREMAHAQNLVKASSKLRKSAKENGGHHDGKADLKCEVGQRLSMNESFLSAASAHCPACQIRVNLDSVDFPKSAPREEAAVQEKNIIHIVQNENADPSSNSSNVIDREILLHILKTKDDAVERLSNDSLKLQETIRSIIEQSNSKDRAIELLTQQLQRLHEEKNELFVTVKSFSDSQIQSTQHIADIHAAHADEKARLTVNVMQLQQQCLELSEKLAATNAALEQERALLEGNARDHAIEVEELKANMRSKEDELRIVHNDKASCIAEFAVEKDRFEGIIARLERQLSAKQDTFVEKRDDQTSRETLRKQQELIDDLREQLQEVKHRDYRHQMTIQKLQAELDECWDRDDERYLSSAQPETIYQLRGLLAETKKVEIIQKEQIEELQQQLSFYQENSLPPAVRTDAFQSKQPKLDLSTRLKSGLQQFQELQLQKKLNFINELGKLQ